MALVQVWNMTATEKIEHLNKIRQKFSFSMSDLVEIFDTDKGGVRNSRRAAGVCKPVVRRGRHDIWDHPAVLHAAQKWEAQQ